MMRDRIMLVAIFLTLSMANAADKRDLCPRPNWAGDGLCDPVNNNEQCEYDFGDCCEDTCVGGHFPARCGDRGYSCQDPTARRNVCEVPSWSGDGLCDSPNNNEECLWDGGDCCEETCEDESFCGSKGYVCKDPVVLEARLNAPDDDSKLPHADEEADLTVVVADGRAGHSMDHYLFYFSGVSEIVSFSLLYPDEYESRFDPDLVAVSYDDRAVAFDFEWDSLNNKLDLYPSTHAISASSTTVRVSLIGIRNPMVVKNYDFHLLVKHSGPKGIVTERFGHWTVSMREGETDIDEEEHTWEDHTDEDPQPHDDDWLDDLDKFAAHFDAQLDYGVANYDHERYRLTISSFEEITMERIQEVHITYPEAFQSAFDLNSVGVFLNWIPAAYQIEKNPQRREVKIIVLDDNQGVDTVGLVFAHATNPPQGHYKLNCHIVSGGEDKFVGSWEIDINSA